jgi:hypothetical protein
MIFVEGLVIVVSTATEYGGFGGRDIPFGCVEVELKYCFSIGVGVN